MTERILRYFGRKQDIEKVLAEMGLSDICVREGGEDLDNRIVLPDTLGDEEYFELCDRLEDGLYAEQDKSIAEVLAEFLTENDLILSTAESCTGGMVASHIIDVPGASKFFHEGVVCYSNQSKMDRLNVDGKTLASYGAVSAEVAKEMAYGLLNQYIDVAVSTTGIAGPTGETVSNVYKPVGLVYVGIAFRTYDPIALKFIFRGNRNEVRAGATNAALFHTYRYLRDNL